MNAWRTRETSLHLADSTTNVPWHEGQQLLHDAHITQLDCLYSIHPAMKPPQRTALSASAHAPCSTHCRTGISCLEEVEQMSEAGLRRMSHLTQDVVQGFHVLSG